MQCSYIIPFIKPIFVLTHSPFHTVYRLFFTLSRRYFSLFMRHSTAEHYNYNLLFEYSQFSREINSVFRAMYIYVRACKLSSHGYYFLRDAQLPWNYAPNPRMK